MDISPVPLAGTQHQGKNTRTTIDPSVNAVFTTYFHKAAEFSGGDSAETRRDRSSDAHSVETSRRKHTPSDSAADRAAKRESRISKRVDEDDKKDTVGDDSVATNDTAEDEDTDITVNEDELSAPGVLPDYPVLETRAQENAAPVVATTALAVSVSGDDGPSGTPQATTPENLPTRTTVGQLQGAMTASQTVSTSPITPQQGGSVSQQVSQQNAPLQQNALLQQNAPLQQENETVATWQVLATSTQSDAKTSTAKGQADGIAKTMGTGNDERVVNVEMQTPSQERAALLGQGKTSSQAGANSKRSQALARGTANAASSQAPSLGQQAAQSMAHHASQTAVQSEVAQQQVQQQAALQAEFPQGMASRPIPGTATGGEGPAKSIGASPSAGAPTTTLGVTSVFGAMASATAPTTSSQVAPQPVLQQQVVDQVKIKISQNAKSGRDTIRIQLRPAELGRVDVELQVHDGRVSAHVTADRQNTLDALKADTRGLERALSDAGLEADTGSLSFSLRDDSGAHLAQSQSDGGRSESNPYGAGGHILEEGLDRGVDDDMQRSHRATVRGGIDIRV